MSNPLDTGIDNVTRINQTLPVLPVLYLKGENHHCKSRECTWDLCHVNGPTCKYKEVKKKKKIRLEVLERWGCRPGGHHLTRFLGTHAFMWPCCFLCHIRFSKADIVCPPCICRFLLLHLLFLVQTSSPPLLGHLLSLRPSVAEIERDHLVHARCCRNQLATSKNRMLSFLIPQTFPGRNPD